MKIRCAAIAPLAHLTTSLVPTATSAGNLKNGGAPRTRTLDTDEGVTVFKAASSTDRTRSAFKWLPDVDSHHNDPFNRRACYFDIIRERVARQRVAKGSRSGFRMAAGSGNWRSRQGLACLFPLSGRVPQMFGHGSVVANWSRASARPPADLPIPLRHLGGLCR